MSVVLDQWPISIGRRPRDRELYESGRLQELLSAAEAVDVDVQRGRVYVAIQHVHVLDNHISIVVYVGGVEGEYG